MVDYVGTDDRLLFSLGDQARGCKDNDYNSLSSVLDSDPDCNGISKDVRELFHKDVVLDSVSSRQVVVPVVSESFDEYRAEKDMAKKLSILEHATPLYEEGDGFGSFVSILLSVIGRKKPIMLLDEPEAFLHPPRMPKEWGRCSRCAYCPTNILKAPSLPRTALIFFGAFLRAIRMICRS